jgi:hypothetical protein
MTFRAVVRMTLDDAEHYTPQERAAIAAAYPEHEREARVKGWPAMGSGRVFPVAEEAIVCEPFAIPKHWPQINGLDFGWDHPFAAVNLAWDRDADCVYVCKDFAVREETPVVHAAAVKAWGDWIPNAWPHDGLQHDKGSGAALKDQYARQGLNMCAGRASFEDGGSGAGHARPHALRPLEGVLDLRRVAWRVPPLPPQGGADREGPGRPHLGLPLRPDDAATRLGGAEGRPRNRTAELRHRLTAARPRPDRFIRPPLSAPARGPNGGPMTHRNDLIPSGAVAVTKSDTAFVDLVGLYVGGAGDVAVKGADGVSATFPGVPAGVILPLKIVQVLSTGTTATNLVGFKA